MATCLTRFSPADKLSVLNRCRCSAMSAQQRSSMIRNLRSCSWWAVLVLPPFRPADMQIARIRFPPLGSIDSHASQRHEITEQTYALYLPTKYSRERRWPIVYVFDPARARCARSRAVSARRRAARLHRRRLEQFAERTVGACNSKRQTRWFSDTQQRFSVDTKRIYFAGFLRRRARCLAACATL